MFNKLFQKKSNPVAKKLTKLAIVVGHNKKRQGANTVKGESEFNYWNGVAKDMKLLADAYGLEVKIFNRKDCGSYSKEIENVYKEVDAWNPSLTLELHFNASGNPKAQGCEMLNSGSKGGMALANALQTEVLRIFGFKDRGVKVLAKDDRGYKSVVSGKSPCVITEPFFGSSPDDMAKVNDDESRRTLALTFLKGVQKAVGTNG